MAYRKHRTLEERKCLGRQIAKRVTLCPDLSFRKVIQSFRLDYRMAKEYMELVKDE